MVCFSFVHFALTSFVGSASPVRAFDMCSSRAHKSKSERKKSVWELQKRRPLWGYSETGPEWMCNNPAVKSPEPRLQFGLEIACCMSSVSGNSASSKNMSLYKNSHSNQCGRRSHFGEINSGITLNHSSRLFQLNLLELIFFFLTTGWQ